MNEFYGQGTDGPYETFDIGDLPLESGGTLRQCKIAFATFGKLTDAKDNVILVATWFGGSNKIMEQGYIGPGRALDPDKYFMIVVNQIGGGLPTSPHSTPFPLGMANFPSISIGDDVVAQQRLLEEHLGIERLALVVGGSMGAQQTYEWAVRFAEKVRRAAAIAGTAKTTPHVAWYASMLADAITRDPAWEGGWYREAHEVREGLHCHSRLWALMGLSPGFLKVEGWRVSGFSSLDDFLLNFLDASFRSMDPNNLFCMARKWRRADVSRRTGGDLAVALGRIEAKVLVLPIGSDMIFTVADCVAEQELIRGSELKVLETRWGHAGLFGMDPHYWHQVDAALGHLLAQPA